VFPVTSDQFNVCLLNISINFFKKKTKILLTPNFWTAYPFLHNIINNNKKHY